ncbi:hypothetical protein COLO4_24790 [Corchorus olitorius]|uniref:Uncharacterized protein n=1 Tax=Corchorus olitorius TaxID=93759 RepID=A0A1R3I6P4_9ROSI|nr:hypothetical protein COLO4_24790 [Corchorus olitorius]
MALDIKHVRDATKREQWQYQAKVQQKKKDITKCESRIYGDIGEVSRNSGQIWNQWTTGNISTHDEGHRRLAGAPARWLKVVAISGGEILGG